MIYMSVSRPPVLIDTNIWIYMLDENDEVKQNLARRLINKNDVVVTTQILNEICINLIKKYGYTELMIKNFIGEMYQKHKVIELSQSIFTKASEFREKYYLGYWDSIIMASAFEAEAAMVYSDKIRDGLVIDGRLGVINPFKF